MILHLIMFILSVLTIKGTTCDTSDTSLDGTCTKAQYDEQYRLQYHFSPPQNWINDPCGLIYDQGEYHLFYQYNPFGSQWGNMHWAHAISTDLVHWQHLPLALYEEDGVMIFTGSSVLDVNNTSGFGEPGNPAIVSLYTGFSPGNGRQDQRLAFSIDQARTFTKYSGNPILDIGSTEFRDPMVFWYPQYEEWKMVITLSVESTIRIYSSKDLVSWTHLSDFKEGELGRIWECPNLFPLLVDGDEMNQKWVMEVAVNGFDAIPTEDFGIQYFIGDFNGTHFINDNPPTTSLWVEQARDFYAPQSWANVPPEDGRRIWIGWFNYPDYAGLMPVSPWRGSHTVPRELTLRTFSTGVRLCQTPVQELESLRQGQSWQYTGVSIPELQSSIIADNLRGNTLEFIINLESTEQSSTFGIELLADSTYRTIIGLNRTETGYLVYADVTNAGEIFSAKFPDVYEASVEPDVSGKLDLRIFVDWSSVEVFAGSGSAVFSLRMFPSTDPDGVAVFGEGFLVDFEAFELSSIWA